MTWDSAWFSFRYCSPLFRVLAHSAYAFPAVLNQMHFAPLGDVWQCLETFLIVLRGAGSRHYYHVVNRVNAQDNPHSKGSAGCC